MILKKRLNKAKKLIDIGDDSSLRYAALEMRLYLEELIYNQTQNYSDQLPENFSIWQPKKIVDFLLQINTSFGKKLTVSISKDNINFHNLPEGQEIPQSFFSKLYHKLGGYLHANFRIEKGLNKISIKKNEILEIYNKILYYSPKGEFHIKHVVNFDCQFCHSIISRSPHVLNDQEIIRCWNNNCNAYYKCLRNNDSFSLEPLVDSFECTNCSFQNILYIHELHLLVNNPDKKHKCKQCNTNYETRIRFDFFPEKKETNK